MSVAELPDSCQEKLLGLMETLEFVRTYLDDLLIITTSGSDNQLTKISEVLCQLQKSDLRINAGSYSLQNQKLNT